MKKATQMLLNLPIRYKEEDIPNDFPCRVKRNDEYGDHDRLKLIIELDTGKILNKEFPKDFSFDIQSLKVCDEGIYILQDDKGEEIAKLEYYVPDCIPNEYGDYINLNIQKGYVKNWYYNGNYVSFDED